MTRVIHANLDQEARWAGVTLPAHVRRRISAMAPLLAALVDEPAEVWAPAPVAQDRLLAMAGWTPPAMRVGVPEVPALAWAEPAAKSANDRRFGWRTAHAAGVALPGSRVIDTALELERHLAGGGAGSGKDGAWVCKAPWTAAGRDRVFGTGCEVGALAARLAGLLTRFGSLVFEPWLDRFADVGVCAHVDPDGRVAIRPPHRLIINDHGQFAGIDLRAPPLETAEHDQLLATVEVAGAALAGLGFAGPFGVDAFLYRDAGRDAGKRRLHPLCEINARFTFGHVAHALGARLATTVLGFGPPPSGARVLVAPTPDDPFTAWTRA